MTDRTAVCLVGWPDVLPARSRTEPTAYVEKCPMPRPPAAKRLSGFPTAIGRKSLKWPARGMPFPTAPNKINDLTWIVDQEVGGWSPPSCTRDGRPWNLL